MMVPSKRQREGYNSTDCVVLRLGDGFTGGA
jgi:hypothetical protein